MYRCGLTTFFKPDIAAGLQKGRDIVAVGKGFLQILLGLLTLGKNEVIFNKPVQSLEHPEEYPLRFLLELLYKEAVIHPISRSVLGGQNQLPTVEGIRVVIECLSKR